MAVGLAAVLLGNSASSEAWTTEYLTRNWVENEEWALSVVTQQVLRGLARAVKTTVAEILANETILAVERPFGSGRPDLVSKLNATGEVVMTDHKVAVELRSEWVMPRGEAVQTSWQVWDYSWRVAPIYGCPRWIRRHLIRLTPSPLARLFTFPMSREKLAQWEPGARAVWSDMARDMTRPLQELTMRLPACGRYGGCEFAAACHHLDRDESRMPTLYQRKDPSRAD